MILLLAVVLVTFLHFSTSHPTTGSGGYTGAPGDAACLNCHNTGSINGNIVLSGLPATVDPGTTYPITVTITNTVGTAARAGFQMLTLKNSTNTNSGTYSVPASESNAIVKTVGSGSNPKRYIGHQGAKTFAANEVIYDVEWTAPTNQDGEEITFYAAALLANGSGTSGDRFTTTNVTATITGGMTTPLTVTVTDIEGIACSGDSNGSATATASGGTPNYNYMWDNGENTATAISLSAGSHTVVVTDDNSNTVSETITIPDAAPISGTVNILQEVACLGGSDGTLEVIATGGTGSLSFSWSNGSNQSQISNLTAGTYSVTIQDENGCTLDLIQTLNEGADVMLNLVATTDPTCSDSSDGTISVQTSGGSAPYLYTWDTPLGNTNGGILSGIPAGTYTVTTTDTNGCSDSNSYTLTAPDAVVASIPNITNESCAGNNDGTAEAAATGGTAPYTYTWTTGEDSQAIFDLAPGSYTVTASDAIGCTAEATVEITAGSDVSVTIAVDQLPSCGEDNGTLTATATGSNGTYMYQWSNGSIDQSIDMLASGTYSVTATDSNGCTAVAFQVLDVVSDLDIDLSGSVSVTCAGFADGTAMVTILSGSGPFSILWNDGSTSESRTGLVPGTYSVTVTDINNCAKTRSITIDEPSELNLTNLITTGTGCDTSSMGSISVEIEGGTTPYEYMWSNGDSLATITNLAEGTYECTVTDANGCTLVFEGAVQMGTDFGIALSANDISCFGSADGSLFVNILGGTSPYAVLWSDGDSTELQRTGVLAGDYAVTVTDDAGCTATREATILEPTAISTNLTSTDETAAGANDGSVSVQPTGGVEPYSVLWSTGEDTVALTDLAAGPYAVTVTDSTGCSVVDSFSIIAFDCTLQVQATAQSISCPGEANGSAIATAMGGTSPYSYVWSNGDTTATTQALPAATYTVTVTDSANCVAIDSATVQEPAADSILVSSSGSILCFGAMDGQLTAELASGEEVAAVLWSTGDTTTTIDSLAPGSYSATITTVEGCTYESLPVAILENTEIAAESITVSDASATGVMDGTIDVSVTGGSEPYTYQWFDESNDVIATTATLTGVRAGEYYLCITDALGCTKLIGPIVVSEPTSSQDLEKSHVNLFPNPAVDILNVQATETIRQVQIFDMQGKLISSQQYDKGQITIETTNYDNGVYLITVMTDQGITNKVAMIAR